MSFIIYNSTVDYTILFESCIDVTFPHPILPSNGIPCMTCWPNCVMLAFTKNEFEMHYALWVAVLLTRNHTSCLTIHVSTAIRSQHLWWWALKWTRLNMSLVWWPWDVSGWGPRPVRSHLGGGGGGGSLPASPMLQKNKWECDVRFT